MIDPEVYGERRSCVNRDLHRRFVRKAIIQNNLGFEFVSAGLSSHWRDGSPRASLCGAYSAFGIRGCGRQDRHQETSQIAALSEHQCREIKGLMML
jgi:hypothetical protein